MSKNKFYALTLAGFLLLGLLIYSGFWFYMAGQIRGIVAESIEDAREDGVVVVTRSLSVGNYPFTPEVRFTGRASYDGNVVEIPDLRVRSTFIAARPLSLKAPQGFSILEPADTAIWSVDYAYIETFVPVSVPATATQEDLQAWKDAGGQISIPVIELNKGALSVKGTGNFILDNALQPAGNFQARVTGHMDFLQWLSANGYVKTKEALLSAAALSALSQKDPETGELFMNADLSLENRTLYVGPLRLAYLPEIQWAWRSGPDRLQ